MLAQLAIGGCFGSSAAQADVYVLHGGGQVSGELQNPDESPRQRFIIRTPAGATITFDRAQLKDIVPESPAEAEYAKVAPTYADTVEDQWRLAEWCRENSLTSHRRTALERVVQLNPEHREARLGLGYTHLGGKWVQRDAVMQDQGYVRYKGQWTLPQEVEVMERRRKEDRAQKQWFTDLRRLRGQLDDPVKGKQALDTIQAISDPFAVPALIQYLEGEPNRKLRLVYVHTLANVDSGPAVNALVQHALEDADEEIRAVCLERLAEKPHPDAVATCVAALRSKENWRVNRAGHALGKLGDKSAVVPLIDALVTTHRFIYTQGSGGMSAGFSSDGGAGLSMGSSTQKIERDMPNQQVLDALVALTGGVNYQFDEKAWKSWYASTRKASIDTRRD